MRARTIIVIITVLVVAAAYVLPATAADAVKMMSKDGIGSYLADGKGMTLYYIVKDKGVKGAGCAGPCLDNWPIFYQEAITAPKGLDTKDFGAITRADGKMQTTFRGWPLYYFVGDKAAGDTNGEGKKDVWHAVTTTRLQPYF